MPQTATHIPPKIHLSVLNVALAAERSLEIESSFLAEVSAWPSKYVMDASVLLTRCKMSYIRSEDAVLPDVTAMASAEVVSDLDWRGCTKFRPLLGRNPLPYGSGVATKIVLCSEHDAVTNGAAIS